LIGNDDFLLLESDLIYEKKALTILIDSDYPNATLVTPPAKQQDGYYLFADGEGLLSGCTTDASVKDQCKGELVGIHKLSNHVYQKMHHWYSSIWQQQPKLGYEFALLEMSKQGEKIHLVKENLFWYEIDDEADLLYAEKNIIHNIRNS
jgi:2-aminoethylphosphonate-pyruvate transaminase